MVWWGLYTGQNTTTAETVDIVSTSASDDVGGVGADTLVIVGLDSDWNEQFDTIAMDGTTTATTWIRLNRGYFISAASSATNVGTVTAVGNSSSNDYFSIPPSFAQTQVAAFSVPKDKTCLISGIDLRSSRANGSEGSCTAYIRIKTNGQIYRYVRSYTLTTTAPVESSLTQDIIVPEMSDVKIFITDVSDANTRVTAAIKYYIYDNDAFNLL